MQNRSFPSPLGFLIGEINDKGVWFLGTEEWYRNILIFWKRWYEDLLFLLLFQIEITILNGKKIPTQFLLVEYQILDKSYSYLVKR